MNFIPTANLPPEKITNDSGLIFPSFVFEDITNFFNSASIFSDPIYQLDNIYFKHTFLEAYNVYIKRKGVYIQFDTPNDSYNCESYYNSEKKIILSNVYYLFEENDFIKCFKNGAELLRSLEIFIHNCNLGKGVQLNKYGEIISKI